MYMKPDYCPSNSAVGDTLLDAAAVLGGDSTLKILHLKLMQVRVSYLRH